MTHAQNSPRGLFQKNETIVTTQTVTTATITTANVTTLDLSTYMQLTSPANKILRLESTAAIPAADRGAAIAIVVNSTGAALAVNSTGTTWKYLLTTSIQPT